MPECRIVTQSNYEEDDFDRGIRTRNKNHMQQPSIGLALLDYDTNPHMPEHISCDTPEALMTKAIEACPELAGIAYSACGSASSGVFKKDTGEAYASGGGMHIYLAIKNVDLEQLRRFLEARLWNAGFGYIAFAKNGAMLVRTVIDTSVLSPERLIYESRPVLGEGIGQKERTWRHHPGKTLKGIPDLTDEESTRYEELVTQAKGHADTVAEAEALLDTHHAGRVRKLADRKQIAIEEA